MLQHAVGEIMRRRQFQLRLTPVDLAERISTEGERLKQTDISRKETGMANLPHLERLGRVANALEPTRLICRSAICLRMLAGSIRRDK